ncbi:Membrane protease subunit, stomatin/prohibitin family, contains C-terminal Zn-ribbon domain [Ruminococcaceae bacterium P7]|nr:Membrane protease subunit, stomatin/prohibitin family, contains C-terminal Zn-ribbon domain [Ruminococcaceae bacterium P7]
MAKNKFQCPQCGVPIRANGKTGSMVCPACGFAIASAAAELGKADASNDLGINVIKYEGDNSTFVWKHPVTDFNMGTMLIVHESQEAVFFSGGQILDTFGPGRHVLKTENIPLLKKFYRIPTGGANMFHAEIYFINRTVQMGIRWGTPDRVRFIDPATGIPLDIGASGDMNLTVADSHTLLKRVVGTLPSLSRDDVLGSTPKQSASVNESAVRYDSYGNRIEDGVYDNTRNASLDADNQDWAASLSGIFRSMVTTTVRTNLAKLIRDLNINILEVDSYLDALSFSLREKVRPGFEAYGLTVTQFFVTNVSLPEDDQNFKKLRELSAASYIGTREAEVQADIVRAKREVEIEKGTTENEMARLEAQREIIRAQAEAEKRRLSGLAEAEVMQAQGYNKKDEFQMEVQKAYAEGIGKMGSGSGGSGGSSVVSDMVGLGVGFAAAGKVGEQFKNMFNTDGGSAQQTQTAQNQDGWSCPSCGETGNRGAFCSGCGKPKPALWDCPSCGEKGNKGAFCSGCGKPKPTLWDCPSCGEKGNKGAFCSGCGKPKDGQA